jgi:hypothetical protein
MTKKYFARSPNFSDENCGANQNSFDFLKKTVVGSKTCVQRENSLQIVVCVGFILPLNSHICIIFIFTFVCLI